MLLYPHFHKFNFNISFLLILSICVFVIGVLYISYAILYPLLLFGINFHRKKTQQLEAGGVHKANEEEGGSTGGENQITSTTGETLTLISAVRHCVVTFEF